MNADESYLERKKLVQKWKRAESKIIKNRQDHHPSKNRFMSEILTPEEMAGLFIDWKWNNALDEAKWILSSKDYYPKTKDYWESVYSLISSSFKDIYICRRCKKETRLNVFTQICDSCNEEELKYWKIGDFGKVGELRNKEEELYEYFLTEEDILEINKTMDNLFPL